MSSRAGQDTPGGDHGRDVDVIVIGGGAGGLTAARHARRRGASVALVSDGPLGGECTFSGCVPSKTLLAAAAEGRSFDAAAASVRSAVERIAATEDDRALERLGVGVRHGRGELVGPGAVRVDGHDLRGRHVILATGSAPAIPPVPGLDSIEVLTNETVFSLDRPPGRLAIVGGGSIGCELAQAFARLGSQVTLIEAEDRLLPQEDPEASAIVGRALAGSGVDIRTGANLVQAGRSGRSRCLRLDDGHDLDVDQVLVAAGRRPVTSGLGLDRVGVEVDGDGHIVVDATCETNVAGIWAVGDVTAAGGYTHVAGNMAFVAATNATRTGRLRPRARVDRRVVPRVTFTDPEVAHVGLSEADAAAVGGRVAEVRFDHVDRAITAGRTEGFVRLLTGPRPVLRSLGGGQVLGATIVGPCAGELVGEVALAMRTRAFTGRLAQTIHAYPTWSMAIQQAASGFFFESEGVEVRPARP